MANIKKFIVTYAVQDHYNGENHVCKIGTGLLEINYDDYFHNDLKSDGDIALCLCDKLNNILHKHNQGSVAILNFWEKTGNYSDTFTDCINYI